MVFGWIAKYILTNETLLKKVADSYAVKLAAQVTAFILHRGKEMGRKKIKKLAKEEIKAGTLGKEVVKPTKVLKTFSAAFKKQWEKEEVKRQVKKAEKKKIKEEKKKLLEDKKKKDEE